MQGRGPVSTVRVFSIHFAHHCTPVYDMLLAFSHVFPNTEPVRGNNFHALSQVGEIFDYFADDFSALMQWGEIISVL